MAWIYKQIVVPKITHQSNIMVNCVINFKILHKIYIDFKKLEFFGLFVANQLSCLSKTLFCLFLFSPQN